MSLPETVRAMVPKLVYGTAWKKERTADLVYQAIKSGFRGIDTACQPKHYQEKLVGDGVRRAMNEGLVTRADLFIQTKYTPISGQDASNVPYTASDSISDQVKTSVKTSLENLTTGPDSYIDSLLLHSPLATVQDTITAYDTLADYVKSGRVRALGISNVTISTLSCLIEFSESRIKPSFVQNRFYADTEYEVSMREMCKKEGIKFQTFWTLTGNPHLLKSEEVAWVSQKTGTSKEVALYALVLGLGNTMILNGTTNAAHMKADLEGLDIIKGWSERAGKSDWEEALWGFTNVIGDAAPS